ncbi:MAG: F0F1 ATP synthase subunit epsilon [Patescibacteria group bacterium]|nr:F0F1 ATP synthase subunit epsilon [Patescibacteria group bacterium]
MSSDLPLFVRIITPNNEMTENVDAAFFHTKVGQIGILPKHAALVSVLEPGIAKLKKGDKEYFYSLGEGFVTVEKNQIIVLTSSLQKAEKE